MNAATLIIRKIKMSAEEVEILKKENDELKDKILQLENKNDILQRQIEELAHKIRDLDRIKQKGSEENCDENCVLCVMVWFCAKKASLPHICGRQLEKIIVVTALTREDIKIDNKKNLVKCSSLIEVLEQCKVVFLDIKYKYPPKSRENARKDEIDKAWTKLMTIDGSKEQVIIGRTKCHEIGHVEICDLTERADGRVTIHDPQKAQKKSFNLDKEHFREHVREDTGLHLYSVKWAELRKMIYCYADIFHYGEKSASNKACTHCFPRRKHNEGQ